MRQDEGRDSTPKEDVLFSLSACCWVAAMIVGVWAVLHWHNQIDALPVWVALLVPALAVASVVLVAALMRSTQQKGG